MRESTAQASACIRLMKSIYPLSMRNEGKLIFSPGIFLLFGLYESSASFLDLFPPTYKSQFVRPVVISSP